jgi:voltage-gated potassium channel
MRRWLDRFLHHPATETALIGLILLWVGLVIVETWLDRDGRLYGAVHAAGDALTLLFILELAARYHVARRKRRFFRNYWLDILSILPILRPFRVLRVLRLLRLLRVGVLLNRRLNSISITLASGIGAQLGVFLVIGVIILVGALTIFGLEGGENSAFDSMDKALWWSFFTLVAGEPIGGAPQTEAGRLVTLLVVVGGLTMFAVFTGVVSAVMVQRLKVGMEVKELGLDELRDHIVICGWNRSVPLMIEELQLDSETRHLPIVVVAEFAEIPELELKRSLDRQRIYFQRGDFTSIDVLEEIGIAHASRAILIADASKPRSDQDRDARTVLAALTIEKLNPRIFTCALLLDRKNTVHLRVAGVEEIIIGDEVSSHLMSTTIRTRGLTEVFMELLTVQVGNEFFKVALPIDWHGLTFWGAAQRLKLQHDAILVAVERWHEGCRTSLVNPSPGEVLGIGDHLVVISRVCPQL